MEVVIKVSVPPPITGQWRPEIKELIDDSVKFHGKLEGKVGAAFVLV